jgi:hypothetical protein
MDVDDMVVKPWARTDSRYEWYSGSLLIRGAEKVRIDWGIIILLINNELSIICNR